MRDECILHTVSWDRNVPGWGAYQARILQISGSAIFIWFVKTYAYQAWSGRFCVPGQLFHRFYYGKHGFLMFLDLPEIWLIFQNFAYQAWTEWFCVPGQKFLDSGSSGGFSSRDVSVPTYSTFRSYFTWRMSVFYMHLERILHKGWVYFAWI